MFHLTTSALKSVPSWNLTPRWSSNVICLPSGDICHDRASSGITLKLRSRATKRVKRHVEDVTVGELRGEVRI